MVVTEALDELNVSPEDAQDVVAEVREDLMEIIDDPNGEKLSQWLEMGQQDWTAMQKHALLYVDSVLCNDEEDDDEP